MTGPSDPAAPVPTADEFAELASALLDGEATDVERARAGEPAVAEAIRRLRRVQAVVGAPVAPVADARRDAAVAAALAAADVGREGSAGVEGLDELSERRARRSAAPARGLRIVGVAAAVLAALAVGATLLDQRDPGSSDDVAVSRDADDSADSVDPAESAGADSGSDGGAPEAVDDIDDSEGEIRVESDDGAGFFDLSLAPLGPLGDFDSIGSLLDVVVVAWEAGGAAPDAPAEGDGGLLRCTEAAEADWSQVASATVAGDDVEVWADPAAGELVVLHAGTCDELGRRTV